MNIPSEMLDLLDKAYDEGLSSDEMRQLEKMLHGNQERIRFLLDYTHLQAEMYIEMKGRKAHTRSLDLFESVNEGDNLSPTKDPSEEELPAIAENILSMLEVDAEIEQRKAEERAKIENLAAEKFAAFRREQDQDQKPRPERNVLRWNNLYTAASSLAAALVIALILWKLPNPVPQQPVFVAQIVDANKPVWLDVDAVMPLGSDLRQGQILNLNAGLLEIEFRDGTRVILEGPAQFALQSRDAGDLRLGKLVAHVPSEAHGFRIQTPGMKIVDLGTEFGVVVNDENKSQVRVFTGLVNLQAEDKAKREIESRLLRPGTTIEVTNPSSAQADASGSVFKQIASVPRLKRTLLARDQEVFTDDFSNVPPGRYSTFDNYGQGGAFDLKQGSLNLRPTTRNTMAVMLTEPSLRLQRGMQFSVDLSANKSGNRRVGLLISTFSGQPDGKANFGFRFNFDDKDIWVHVYEKPLDARPSYTGKRPGAAIHKLPSGPLTLTVEWVGDTTFKFYCQSRGNPNRFLVDTRSIKALKDFSELYVGVQCYREKDSLVARCSRLTIGPAKIAEQTLD